MSLIVCLDYANFIPLGLRSVLCAYRSLFTFIDIKLLQKSLKEMEKMSFELQADGTDTADEKQVIEYEITAYFEKFADDYCRNLKTDLQQ